MSSASGLLDSSIFSDSGITAAYELWRALELEKHGHQVRLEIWYWHSNPNCHWDARLFKREGHFKPWIPWPEFPWVQERDEEAAIRAALDFLNERIK